MRIHKTLMLAAALSLAAFSFSGCKTPGSPEPPRTAEQIAASAIDLANDSFVAAVRVWGEGWESRRRANIKTKLRDPGGFLERQTKLTAEVGKVQNIQAKFTAAENAAVEAWLKAKSASLPVPAEPDTDKPLKDALKELEDLSL